MIKKVLQIKQDKSLCCQIHFKAGAPQWHAWGHLPVVQSFRIRNLPFTVPLGLQAAEIIQFSDYNILALIENLDPSNESLNLSSSLKNICVVLASAAHILKLEQYREDQHGPCARMTRKFVKRSIFLKKEKKKKTFVLTL